MLEAMKIASETRYIVLRPPKSEPAAQNKGYDCQHEVESKIVSLLTATAKKIMKTETEALIVVAEV